MRLILSLLMLLSLTSCGSAQGLSLELLPVARFDSRLSETSGLIRWQQGFISHNDSGNAPELFVLNDKGKISARLTVPTKNHDWEDIAAQGNTLYLADTGNNSGQRRELKILVLKLAQDTLSLASILPVAYAEQTNFQPPRHQHNFDAEALTKVDDELWLFTKRWLDQETAIYKLSTHQGAMNAVRATEPTPLQAQQQLNTQMLVTGADFDDQTKTLMLLGYSRSWFNRHAWIWLYPVHEGRVLEHLGRKLMLSENGQFEGISLADDGFIYVTREGRGTNLFRSQQTLATLMAKEPSLNNATLDNAKTQQ
ncbi:hypothetical protein CBP31_14055 [Oceanisphaera profunda]|uniref:Phytase-like domain-containing protein n=1 Tax=Oceanisphaera profunda TaxID=1416627 RepID=A0A1Y0D8L0_9GAMM|nr:hypothetical protein [Oceanisphaera profunda]ART83614.1 hypothetical protein CBP31_14055 [Oceanisphaera profunda]